MLQRSACGFGAVALSGLLTDHHYAAGPGEPFAPLKPHFAPKCNSVIYLYMDGGPSQVDTWDPKPQLQKDSGKPFSMKIEPTQFNNIGTTLGSPWKFAQHGNSGIPVSELFPNVAQHVDDLAVIRSMTSDFSEHTNGNYFLHTGNGQQGWPSMGAWFAYGLGTECQDLPGFIVLDGGLIPPGGLDNFNSGFLPATYQGSIFNSNDPPLANIRRSESSDVLQRNKLDLLDKLDAGVLERIGHVDQLEAAIANYELAYRMQAVVPELTDLSDESSATVEMYGLHTKTKGTATFGRQCLLARRLVERGVRFIELTCPSIGHDRWDQHAKLVQGHADNARAVDQPIAALLTDLKRRGLLQSTLVVWSGEFGRTPFAQGDNGRDHNPFGFTVWMAGGGVKGGTVHGATDEYGYKAVENVQGIHDLHATMLHLSGMDHERLTFRFSGRDMRLTNVSGQIMHEILS
ncbi:MAG: sulfatase [Planctomycetaceae bacterium]|nr:sulfatase [Planctomycetaceae bacterium]MBP61087.1 sulfatase [Planctomycetaceae bacterium]